MAGASAETKRVTYINANLVFGEERFELLIVLEDETRHTLSISAEGLAALGPLLRSEAVLLFDPPAQTLILANLIGQWLPHDWTSGKQS
jgi:hypothetical protein